MSDPASDLEIALRAVANAVGRETIAAAGGKPALLRVVGTRLQAEVRNGAVHVWARPASSDGEMTLGELIEELKMTAPNAFEAPIRTALRSPPTPPKPQVERVDVKSWHLRVATANAADRQELLRRAAAGEIQVRG